MDPKIIEALLSELYKYVIIGGIVILAGIMLKSFLSVLATNLWMRWFSRSKSTVTDADIYIDGYWWKLKELGFNRVKLSRPNFNDKGERNKDDPDIYMEIPVSQYWKSKVVYK